MSSVSPASSLRQGYSTGACIAACVAAAWDALVSPDFSVKEEAAEGTAWELLFPDGKQRILILKNRSSGFAAIAKDGGDDPDCTHGAELYARVRTASPDEAGTEDYLLSVRDSVVILRAVEGIGLCTRPGLDCDQGHWAVNTGPRHMIAANLERAGLASGCFLAEIGVREGTRLAEKTLNARLGILGGISILGTTGIVKPFSHEAYIETIRICMRSSRLLGYDEVVLCTGGRTMSQAKKYLPEIPEAGFVCMGDFVGESLRAAQEQTMRRVTIACMPGKLCKYAAGFENTHAHKVDQDMTLFQTTLEKLYDLPEKDREVISRCASVRQALEHVPASYRKPLYANLCKQAFEQFSLKAPGLEFRLLVCDFDGSLLLETISPAPPRPCHP